MSRSAGRLILLFCLGFVSTGLAAASPVSTPTVENVVLMGWDGARRQDVQKLLADGLLPNLSRLTREGGLAATRVTTGETETKPGWAEILTGVSADRMGIESNKVYRPIPEGCTIFEILKRRFKGKIATLFIAGKTNNLAARGPHEVCVNCDTRQGPNFEKTWWWDREKILPGTRTRGGLPRRWVPREGEPYFNTVKSLDVYRVGLGAAENVGKEMLAALDRYHGSRFMAFFHLEEPDEEGHVFGQPSDEYARAIQTDDHWLGVLVEKLKFLGIYDRTAVFVTSDHGFDVGQRSHRSAPDTFFAANRKRSLRDGDRKDVAPTLLEAFGIDPSGVAPAMEGRSLFVPENRTP